MAVLSGTLTWLANPPADVGPLAFVALVPLLWSLRGARARRGALLGFAYGLVYFGLLLNWLLLFGVVAELPLVLSQAAATALFGALAPSLMRSDRPIRTALAMAASWTAVDWVRSSWPLGGFTWGGLGYTQHGDGLLLPLASVAGVWGVTFVVVLVNGLALGVGERLRSARGPSLRRAVAPAGLAALAIAAVVLPALIPQPGATGPRLDVAVVQGNVPRSLASDRLLQTATVAQNHIDLNRRLIPDPPDLAVWPENALPTDPAIDARLGAAVSSSISDVGAPTLVGAIAPAGGGRFYNQVLLYSGTGRVQGRYTKIHLVPWGEYVPWRWLFAWTERYRRGNADLVAGHTIRLFHVDGAAVGTPICFENTFPDLFRRFVHAGATVMVVATNDSSFLESVASREHVIMSQLRAVENGRWIVQAAISGESAVVDPSGRIVAHTGLFEPAILRYRVPTSDATTLYTRLGDWLPRAGGLWIGAILLLRVIRRRRGRGTAAVASPTATTGSTPPAGERTEPATPIAGGGEPRVLVVLPTFNERATIARVLAEVTAVGPDVYALVIDDNSPDGTGEVVAAMAEQEPRVRLLRRPGKLGLASAYLTGFRIGLSEGFDVIVEMDSDLSHRPEDLPRLIEGAARYDLTIGSRYVPGGHVSNWSRLRLGLSRAGNAYARIALRLPVTDATSGFRSYRRPLLQALVDDGIGSEGYVFQIELAYRAHRLGYVIGEVPITFREREHGRSKLSRRMVLEAILKVGQWGVRDRFRSNGRP
jgi:apolipoprotein N-acyltransferase